MHTITIEGESYHLLKDKLTEEDFKVVTQTEEEFLRKTSEWEKIFSADTGANMAELRQILCMAGQARKFSQKKMEWLYHRWQRCLFDAIGPQFFLLTEVFVPVPLSPEKMEKWLKPEVEYRDSRGCKDIMYVDLLTMTWGETGNTRLMREKLNGVHVERVKMHNKYLISMLGLAMEVDQFESETLEWTERGLFSLYPYGLPNYVVSGIPVVDHVWVGPNATDLALYEEGVILLYQGEERRMKRDPSVDIDIDGYVWEVCRVSRDPDNVEDVVEELSQIRPRFGKSPADPDLLDCYPDMSVLRIPPHSTLVSYTHTGPFLGKCRMERNSITIDSGFRVRGDRLCHVDHGIWDVSNVTDVLNRGVISYYIKEGQRYSGPTVAREPSYSGCKAIVFDEDRVYCVQDEGKPLDFVGGSVVYGETPMECVVREIFEETGNKVLEAYFLYLGNSSIVDDGVLWNSYVYLVPFTAFQDKTKFISLKGSKIEKQPWVSRILTYSQQICGTEFHYYYKDRKMVYQQKDNKIVIQALRSVMIQEMCQSPIHTGQDLRRRLDRLSHHEVDVFAKLSILSRMIRVTPRLDVLCSHSDECMCVLQVNFEQRMWGIRLNCQAYDIISWLETIMAEYVQLDGTLVSLEVAEMIKKKISLPKFTPAPHRGAREWQVKGKKKKVKKRKNNF